METLQLLNALAAGSLMPCQGHGYFGAWKHAARLRVPCGSRAGLAAALALPPPAPCQCPASSHNWEHFSDRLSFNQLLLQSFAAQPRYNSLQTIKALHLSWIIRGLRPAGLVINSFLGGIV